MSPATDLVWRGQFFLKKKKMPTLVKSALLDGLNTFRELPSFQLSKFSDLILKDDQHGLEPFED